MSVNFFVFFLSYLFCDFVLDLCACLVCFVGLFGAVNVGDDIGVFEVVHGSAPDIAGKNIANPTALLRSALLMLDHIGEAAAARRIEAALVAVLATPERTTRDLGGKASTSEFTHAIVQALHDS